MSDFARDPFNNIIQAGIKDDIQFCFDNQRYRAMVALVYSAIDSMAFLCMPAHQDEVKANDFISWADRYFKIDHPDAPTAVELYGARCAMLHTYGVKSRISKRDDVRLIGFMNDPRRKVVYRPNIEPKLVLVSLLWFKHALISGASKCIIDVQSNPAKFPKTEERLKWMMGSFPATRSDAEDE